LKEILLLDIDQEITDWSKRWFITLDRMGFPTSLFINPSYLENAYERNVLEEKKKFYFTQETG